MGAGEINPPSFSAFAKDSPLTAGLRGQPRYAGASVSYSRKYLVSRTHLRRGVPDTVRAD